MDLRTNGILAAILGCFFLLSYGSVYAHGGGTPRLTNEVAGPFRLYAWSSPEPLRVGEVHLTLAVVLPPEDNRPVDETALFNDLEQIVTGANVNITFRKVASPDSGDNADVTEQISVLALPSDINPLYYEMDTVLEEAGAWVVTVDTSADLGSGAVDFQVLVEDSLTVNWAIVAGGIVLLLLIIGFGRTISKSKRRQS